MDDGGGGVGRGEGGGGIGWGHNFNPALCTSQAFVFAVAVLNNKFNSKHTFLFRTISPAKNLINEENTDVQQ